MKIQFCFNGDFNAHPIVIAEFDVAEVPTNEQCKAIEDEIYNAMNEWENENEDFAECDFWEMCHDVVIRHLHIEENPVVKTFYI